MFDNLYRHIQKYITLQKEEKAILEEFFTYIEIPKKTLLLSEGEICDFEAFILKGCVRIYYIDKNGFEITLQFATDDWWVSDIASFHEQKPSHLYIETLEDSVLCMLSLTTKEMLLQRIPKFERFFRLLVQRHVSALQQRLIQSISQTATERYLSFIEMYPEIPQRVAQHYIASYLGISPEFVSKIRKRLAQS